MDSTTANKTTQVLRGLFSRYGTPHILVSDNGPQFFSDKFSAFFEVKWSQTHPLGTVPSCHKSLG